MKKLLPSLLTLLTVLVASSAISQTTLWVGEPSWSGGSSNIFGYDTTGGAYTLTTTLPLSSDATASVQGVHGLALSPTGDMYILYQDPSAGASARRLGIIDLTTGDITDIGDIGNMRDLEFSNGVLYAVGGRQSDGTTELWEVNVSDASTTLVGNFTNPWNGVAVANNIYTDQLYYANTAGPDFGTVDVDPFGENLLYGSYGVWCRAMTMKNDSTMIMGDGSQIREYNFNTNVATGALAFHTGSAIHAMAFEQYPLSALVDGPTTFCSNNPSTLYVNESGTSYQWYVDGTLIPGGEDSTHVPNISGDYFCVLNGTDTTFSAQVLVLPAPVASFTSDPEPVSLGLDPSGNVDFTNTSIPNGNAFWWDFAGFNTTVENPSFSFTTPGTHDVTFIVYDTLTGCSDTTTGTVTVIDDVGIGELNGDVSIYPIPTEDIVTVSVLSGNGTHTIQLMDLQGRLITEQSITAGADSKVIFDLTDFESGVYLIKVSDLEYEGFYKVIKK